jgi:2-polyprenyl-3-methyl-5-hydroxy-6-metoxy-1,4-benzoquinol methylase
MSPTTKAPSFLSRLLSGLFFWRSGDYQRRYGKAYGSNSVDYRRNRRMLMRGEAPRKMRELAAIIPGESVVDVGAGEGVLAMLLAEHKQKTRAIDVTPRRHVTGKALQETWRSLGKDVDNCEMLLGDALADPDLLNGFDTLVMSRVIYYFGDRIDPFISEAAKRVSYVCLVGNASRNRRLAKGKLPADIGEDVIYSTHDGMIELLQRHGFEIVEQADFGDPIVIGRRVQATPATGPDDRSDA